ncbi:MAG: murein biosynthesis integral membrane protein MurJ [Rhodospirillaceae bacterium]
MSIRFFHSIATIGILTLISRILGFVRDILIAATMGAGPVSDAFFIALKLPNFFRTLSAEGAFNVAFVPLFARKLAADGVREAVEYASTVLSVMVIILLAFVALAQIGMPIFMYGFAPGFSDDPIRFKYAVDLTRITFPYLLFISLVSLLGGVLNSFNRFAAAAASPILLNLFLIGAVLILAPVLTTPGHALAWGVAAAGVGQLVWLMICLRSAGICIRLPTPRISPEIRLLFSRMVPGALGAGIAQMNLLIGIFIASFLPSGSVSFLFYADRLNQLPLGVIGIAIGTVLLPVLSRQLGQGEYAQASVTMNRALEIGLLFAVPSALGLAILAEPIITILFERGAFQAETTEATALALVAYTPGLPAYFLIKVLAPGFFAREDTKTPVKIAATCVLINVTLSLILINFLSHAGIALASSIAAWLNVLLLIICLKRAGFHNLDQRLKERAVKICISALGMGGLLWVTLNLFEPTGLEAPFERIGALLIIMSGALLAYGALSIWTGAATISEIRDVVRRKTTA